VSDTRRCLFHQCARQDHRRHREAREARYQPAL